VGVADALPVLQEARLPSRPAGSTAQGALQMVSANAIGQHGALAVSRIVCTRCHVAMSTSGSCPPGRVAPSCPTGIRRTIHRRLKRVSRPLRNPIQIRSASSIEEIGDLPRVLCCSLRNSSLPRESSPNGSALAAPRTERQALSALPKLQTAHLDARSAHEGEPEDLDWAGAAVVGARFGQSNGRSTSSERRVASGVRNGDSGAS